MSDFKCPFCGSDKLRVTQPYKVKKKKPVWGEDLYENAVTFCCKAQEHNQKYIDARYHKTLGTKPSLDEVGKL